MDCPCAPHKRKWIDKNLAIQALQKHTHLVAEECKAQDVAEQEEAIIGRLVSANCPSTFEAASGVKPWQYAGQRQKATRLDHVMLPSASCALGLIR